MFTEKQAQPSDDSRYTELRNDSGIMGYNSSSESYQHVTAKSEVISQSAGL
jgi:hypothetical protein